MALTIKSQPPLVAYTKNPIVFAWETDHFAEYNDRMIMKIAVDYGTGFEQIGEFEKRPNIKNVFIFDISSILNSAIQEYDMLLVSELNWSSPAKKCSKSILKYQINVVEFWGTGDDKDEETADIEGKFVIGGIADQIYPLIDPFFHEYLATTKMFLTWQPIKQVISPLQPITLFLFNYSAESWNNLYVHFSVNLLDGGSLTTDLFVQEVGTVVDVNEIVILPVGIDNAGLQAAYDPKKIVSYTVTVLNEETQVSETRIYVVDYVFRWHEKNFAFLNSLGGIDHIRTIGRFEPKADYSGGTFEREKTLIINDDGGEEEGGTPATYDPLRHLKGDFDVSEQESFKVFSGPLTNADVDAYRDFRLSPHRYEYIIMASNTKYIPILVDNKSFSFPKTNEYPFNIDFVYKHAFENKVYTPTAKFLF